MCVCVCVCVLFYTYMDYLSNPVCGHNKATYFVLEDSHIFEIPIQFYE